MRPGPLVTVVYPDLESNPADPPLRSLVGQLVGPNTIHEPYVAGIGHHAAIKTRVRIVVFAQLRELYPREADAVWTRLDQGLRFARSVPCPSCPPTPVLEAPALVDTVTTEP